jgi:hypothetical protein
MGFGHRIYRAYWPRARPCSSARQWGRVAARRWRPRSSRRRSGCYEAVTPSPARNRCEYWAAVMLGATESRRPRRRDVRLRVWAGRLILGRSASPASCARRRATLALAARGSLAALADAAGRNRRAGGRKERELSQLRTMDDELEASARTADFGSAPSRTARSDSSASWKGVAASRAQRGPASPAVRRLSTAVAQAVCRDDHPASGVSECSTPAPLCTRITHLERQHASARGRGRAAKARRRCACGTALRFDTSRSIASIGGRRAACPRAARCGGEVARGASPQRLK